MSEKSILKIIKMIGSFFWIVLSCTNLYLVSKGLYYSLNKDNEIKEIIIKGLKNGQIQHIDGGYFLKDEFMFGMKNPAKILKDIINNGKTNNT